MAQCFVSTSAACSGTCDAPSLGRTLFSNLRAFLSRSCCPDVRHVCINFSSHVPQSLLSVAINLPRHFLQRNTTKSTSRTRAHEGLGTSELGAFWLKGDVQEMQVGFRHAR